MDAAAKALGMSSSDVQSALQGGKSLSQLATDQGKKIDDVKAAISDAISKANPSISSDRAAKIAQRMMDGPASSASAAAAGSTGVSSVTGTARTTGTGGVDRDNDGDGR